MRRWPRACRPRKEPEAPAGRLAWLGPVKILLLKLNHLGDTLLLTPTLRMLRHRFPEARIDVAVRRGPHEVLEGNPDFTRLFLLPAPVRERGRSAATGADSWRALRGLSGQRYDYAFDLSNSDRARFWMWLALARNRCANNAYGELHSKQRFYNRFSTYAWGPEHQVLKDFRTVTDILHLDADPGPLVVSPQRPAPETLKKLGLPDPPGAFAVIHPTSRWAFKQWRPERWSAVADWLAGQAGLNVLFSCGPEAREVAEVDAIVAGAARPYASARGAMGLRELAWVLGQARLFCGVDTVAMHLAAAAQTPTVALFGPSSEWSWHPWQVRHQLVLGPCSCKLTRKFVCDKAKPYPCMDAIATEAVIAAIQTLLSHG